MTPLILFVLLHVLTLARGKLFWKECKSEADHPPAFEGNFHNLCVSEHVFDDLTFAWDFDDAVVKQTLFNRCTFRNSRDALNSFTLTFWQEVVFDSCRFEGFTADDSPILFNKMEMRNVKFIDTVFDHSISLQFDEFQFTNVTFDRCTFMGDTLFSRGAVAGARFIDSNFMRSVDSPAITSDSSVTFSMVTIGNMHLRGNVFVHPIRFESVNAADIVVNQTTFNQFHCHSEPDPESGKVKHLTRFNDTFFENTEFKEPVICDLTTWRGFGMENVVFWNDAIFSKSKIDSIFWNHVSVDSSTRDCHELNFSDTSITERLFANVSANCDAFFDGTSFERVRVDNLNFTRSSFCRAKFRDQEFVDEQCCTEFCQPRGCDCDISEPSGICPAINETDNGRCPSEDGICFPADATVRRSDGTVVSMEELALRDTIAVGGGKHSDVFFFGHRVPNVSSKFVVIQHIASSTPLRLSKQHYLYVNGRLASANSVRAGDRLRGESGVDDVTVLSVSRQIGRGLYAPASMHGDLLVDGVTVSSYTTALHPQVSHFLLSPLRLLYRLGFRNVVERLNVLDRTSWEPFARRLRLKKGPEVTSA